MKLLRNAAVCALVCAMVSAAPVRGVQRKIAMTEASAKPGDPEWVESMQRLLKELADDNAKLRSENDWLRASNKSLKRQVEEYEAAARRALENRGALAVPPGVRVAPPGMRGNEVPPNWRPFEFNGATYSIVPLEHQHAASRPSVAAPAARATINLPEATK